MDKHGHLLLSINATRSLALDPLCAPSLVRCYDERASLPASDDRSAHPRKKNTGDPAPRWEVARGWRLGRRRSLLCVGSDGSCERGQRRLIRREAALSKPLVFITPARILPHGSSVYMLPYAAKRELMENG